MAGKGEATLLLKIKTAGEEALGKLESSFDSMKTTALVAFAAISGAIIKGIAEYKESEQNLNALTQALVNNGIYSRELKDSYLNQADALSKLTTFEDDAIIKAQIAAQQQLGRIPITKELTEAILDFAQAQGIDAAQAAEVVGKSIGTSTNALARYGIEVTKGTSDTEKMTQVIDGLNAKFGGQAQAAGKGLGVIDKLKNSFGEIAEDLGRKVAPAIELIAQRLLDFTNNSSNIEPILNGIVGIFNFVSKAVLEAGYLINYFTQQWKIFGETIGQSYEAAISGNISSAIEKFKAGDEKMRENSIALKQQLIADIAAIDNSEEIRKQQQLQREEEALKQSLLNKQNAKIIASEEEKAREEELWQAQLDQNQLAADLLLAQQQGNSLRVEQLKLQNLQNLYKHEEDHNKKRLIMEAIYAQQEVVNEKKKNEAIVAARQSTLSLLSGMAQSQNSTLAAIGKAAALTEIAIKTPQAVADAYAWGNAFGGPPVGAAFGAAAFAAMSQQAAKVSGVQLAEGGVVMPRNGGVQATIGEAGQPEVVIPLDRAGEFGIGGGGGVTINVYGGLLGDERSAQEFAIAVDRKLLELRQNGGSVAFDRIT